MRTTFFGDLPYWRDQQPTRLRPSLTCRQLRAALPHCGRRLLLHGDGEQDCLCAASPTPGPPGHRRALGTTPFQWHSNETSCRRGRDAGQPGGNPTGKSTLRQPGGNP